MEEGNTSDFTSYILLCVSGLLVFIDCLELAHIISNWEYTSLFILPMFEKCIKYELISKTIFAVFSLISALSAFFLSFSLLFFQRFFLDRLLKTFFFVNYIFYGPLMLILSLLGLHHWDEAVYVCEKNDFKIKEISVSNSVTIVGCFLISFIVTILIEFYESFNFLLDSITKRDSGSPIIGKFFWKVVFLRSTRERIRAHNRVINVNSNVHNQYQNSENIINNNANNNNNNNVIPIEDVNHLNNHYHIHNNGDYNLLNNNNSDINLINQNNIIIVNEEHRGEINK